MQQWWEFYEVIGGAAATLLGLLFVSVSVNAKIILSAEHVHSRRLAEQAFQNYLAVMMLALLTFFPGMNVKSFGISMLLTIGIWCVWIVIRVWLTVTGTHDAASRIATPRSYTASLIGFGMMIFAGARMALGDSDSRKWAGIGAMVLLVTATIVSWRLLLRIAADKAHPDV